MSRDDGFDRADIDTGLLADPKIVALARRLRDPVQTAAHAAVYLALVLASWRAGARLTLDDAMPAWWLESADNVRANLAAVGLLDDEARIPIHAFEAWFRPAWTRRETARAKGRKGGLTKPNPSPAEAQPKPSLSLAQPDRQTGPTDRPTVLPSAARSSRNGQKEMAGTSIDQAVER